MAVVWSADYTQATNVAAGYVNSGSQRQNGAGTFNDTTVPWPITIQTAPGGRPGRAIPFTIPDNYRRYEQVPTHQEFGPGDSFYFGWSFYLDPSFPLEAGIDYQVIEQIHQAWGSWSPPIAFEAMNNALYLTGGNGLIRSVSATDPLTTWAHFQKLQDLQVARWYNVVYQVENFSTQPNTSTISVWVDGTQLLNQYVLPCPTLVQGDAATITSYRKQGFYHRETIHGGTIWHAGARLATTYADADPTPVVPASASGRPGRGNLLPNPAAAVDTAGWTVGTSDGALSRVAVTGMDRPFAIRCTQVAEAFGVTPVASPFVPAQPGKRYSATVQFRVLDAVPANVSFYVQFLHQRADGALFLGGTGDVLTPPTPGVVYRRSLIGTVTPVDTVAVTVRVVATRASGAVPTGTRWEITAARIEQSDDPDLSYADGDTPGWSWLDTPGSSPSKNPAAAPVVRYNQVTNPAVEQSTTGWEYFRFGSTVDTTPPPTVSRASVSGMLRPWAVRLVSDQVHNYAYVGSPVPVTPGQPYGFAAQVRFSFIPETTAGYYVRWEKSDGNFLSSATISVRSELTVNVPYLLQAIRIAPAGAAQVRFGARWTSTTPGGTVDLTAIRIEPGWDAGGLSYADGATGGWAWDGTSGSSASRSVPLPNVLPGTATSVESAPAVSRKRVRAVGIAATELDTANRIGLLRGGALVGTLVDTFEAGVLDEQWTAAGAIVTPTGRLAVACAHTAGAPTFSNARTTMGYVWNGSALLFEVLRVPTVAGVDTAFAQMWVMDPSPASTVDRLGFEYRAAANALDLVGHTGAGFAAIGTTITLTYSATNHRWLRISHLGTSIVWATSADGLTWTTQRTLATPPAWTTKTTLKVSFEAYRSTGTNDTFEVDSINLPPLRVVRPVRGLSAVGRSFTF